MSEPPYIRLSDGTVREGKSVGAAHSPSLALEGADLSWIQIYFQTRLVFAKLKTNVVIGSPFTLTFDGQERSLDPEVRGDLGPLLAIYPGVVAVADIDLDLTLRLRFTNGAAIDVSPDPHYEAWQVEGPGSRLIVCGPGSSGLSVWA